jgi:hypothetical protein
VTVKVVVRDGREEFNPEFEDCRRIAQDKGLPLMEVVRVIEKELEGSSTS